MEDSHKEPNSKSARNEPSSLECMDGDVHNGDHMKEVQRSTVEAAIGIDKVTYWCESCGASVTDLEADHRLYEKGEMKFSELFKKTYNN